MAVNNIILLFRASPHSAKEDCGQWTLTTAAVSWLPSSGHHTIHTTPTLLLPSLPGMYTCIYLS